jgi:hypothetical protein
MLAALSGDGRAADLNTIKATGRAVAHQPFTSDWTTGIVGPRKAPARVTWRP